MADLARPRLVENRPGYRLVDLAWANGRGRMAFGYTSYFESIIDTSTVLGHELAAASVVGTRRSDTLHAPVLGDLPYRRLVGDPFDLARRPVLPSLDTLTIRRSGGKSTFFLHRRDARSVATAGSVYHVMPAGSFQPSSIAPWHQANDFSLWHALVREYAEEFLGEAGADGSGPVPIDRADLEPTQRVDKGTADPSSASKAELAARLRGSTRVWCEVPQGQAVPRWWQASQAGMSAALRR